MKFQLLIVVVGVLLPCSLAQWSDFTNQIMESVPITSEDYTSYYTYLFPDILSQCDFSQIATSYPDLSPAVVDWITNTRQNYVPWCQEIQGYIDVARANTEATVLDAITHFNSVGDDIEWAYNMITTVLTGKACAQETIDTFTQTFSSNVTQQLQQVYYWQQMTSYLSEIIPSSAIYGFNSYLQQCLYQPIPSPLQAVKNAEFMYMEETIRLYKTAAEYTEWYLEGVTRSSFQGTRSSVHHLIDGAVMMARATVC